MGEAAPVKGARPNLFVVVGWLFVAVTVTLIILENTT
jgi:hypothetical protein